MWLATGLRVPHNFSDQRVCHRPLIGTEAVFFDHKDFLVKAHSACGIIISSQETVRYLEPLWSELASMKAVFVTGDATCQAVSHVYQGPIYKGVTEDQEGLVEVIIQKRPQNLLYVRAQEVRGFLKKQLDLLHIDCEEIICYKTFVISQTLELPENLKGYIFSSPSTVKAFKQNFGFPKHIPIRVKGHVTWQSVVDTFGDSYAHLIDFY